MAVVYHDLWREKVFRFVSVSFVSYYLVAIISSIRVSRSLYTFNDTKYRVSGTVDYLAGKILIRERARTPFPRDTFAIERRSYYLFLTSVMPSPRVKRKATNWLNGILLRCAFVFKPRYTVFLRQERKATTVVDGAKISRRRAFISMQRSRIAFAIPARARKNSYQVALIVSLTLIFAAQLQIFMPKITTTFGAF